MSARSELMLRSLLWREMMTASSPCLPTGRCLSPLWGMRMNRQFDVSSLGRERAGQIRAITAVLEVRFHFDHRRGLVDDLN